MWLLLGVSALLLGAQQGGTGSGDLATTSSTIVDRTASGTADTAARRSPGKDRPAPVRRYVALGDSYTAGSGITPDDGPACRRSVRNYPNRLAERLGAHLDDASCGGATTDDVDAEQWTPHGMQPPQITDVDRRTDLVTLGLGVNDADYGILLVRCLEVAQDDPSGSPCRDSFRTPEGGDQILDQIPRVGDKVERVVRLVQRKAPGAQVIVVGYPQLVPKASVCHDLPFALGDYGYLAEYLLDLNNALRTAARDTGADFVDVYAASAGHDICAGPDAWVLGAWPDSRTQVFHPFANEQRAIAALVAAAVR